jgi:hypothetical protein
MVGDMLQAALSYVAEGFKVFPVKPDKKPLTEHGLKDATQLQMGVEEYWKKWPDAGIALVTDGLVVLDFDAKSGGAESKKAIEAKYGSFPRTRTHRTGGGGLHYLYRNPNGHNIRSKVAIGGYSGVDLRANGGYIVVPPSRHESGNYYEVIDDTEIAPAPPWIVELATKKQVAQAELIPENQPILKGKRSNTLTSFAGSMRRRGMPQAAIEAALIVVNDRQCQPPLPETTVKAIARSVSRYPPTNPNGSLNNTSLNRRDSAPTESERYKTVTESVTKPLAEKIEEWVRDSSGWFSYEDIDKEFGLNTGAEKLNRRVIMKRLKDAGTIEAHPQNNKLFRFVNTAIRLIDFKSATKRTPLAIKYPFGIERFFNTYPGNIIVLAGAADAGKTAFLLNLVRLNMYDFSIFYQSSEMGKEELASRLSNFEGITLDEWNFKAEERSHNFADVIRPDCVNIIDFMELSGDFYMVAEYLRQIHDKLAGGICIVALQKKREAELGRGGDFGLEKPRLYMCMDAGKLTIQKAKNWVDPTKNPNGLTIKFKLVGGCKFIYPEDWHKDEK